MSSSTQSRGNQARLPSYLLAALGLCLILVQGCAGFGTGFSRTGLVQGISPGARIESGIIIPERDLLLAGRITLDSGSVTVRTQCNGIPQGRTLAINAPGGEVSENYIMVDGGWNFVVEASPDAQGSLDLHLTDR